MDPSRSDGRLSARAEAALVSRTCEVSDVSFRAFLDAGDPPRIHWAAPDGFETVGVGAAARLTAEGPDRFDAVRERAADLFSTVDAGDPPPAAGPRAFGGFAFHEGHEAAAPWAGFPGAEFVVPRLRLTRTEDSTWLSATASGPDVDGERVEARLDRARERVRDLPAMRPSGEPAGVVSTRRTTSRSAWVEGVESALDRIERGELRKVVLALALEATLEDPLDVPAVLERLRRTYPECHRFLVEPAEGGAFFGAPPENLVTLRGRRVETEALAGSVGRGDTPEADDALVDALTGSEKVGREHDLVVEAIREQLAPLAAAVDVGDRVVRKLATIQHLRTPITADLADDEHVLSIIEALHPTPAVGGLPPGAALATIRETETFDRGWYAAPVGWFDADGDGSFAVAIRSAVARDRTATLFAGNGIVADSDPADEWEEVKLKFRPILDELERGGTPGGPPGEQAELRPHPDAGPESAPDRDAE